MFGDTSFWQLFIKGGAAVFFLLGVSVLSWWIIIDRAICFSRIKVNTLDFMDRVKKMLAKKDKQGVLTLCQTTPGPLSAVIRSGMEASGDGREKMEAAMQRTLNYEAARMQKFLGILATVGSVSPFVGLFGTILGIIKAFRDLALAHGGGPSVVANGIAEALVATAMGIFVAIPAVVGYNLFVRAIDNTETETINAASELADLMD
ncbi:MAG: MotA/TolQ/ExbB proton channel family protein [Candidatus Goldiibacteriota bacterium HGW-Goldbacteria-1]|jgi:biopolymer transport protein ExbB|nr:MAG: MotA/TolQ/ExbB proton channel family protein [Candidatus Goldiibacteriota bacterium HGW-Goldbacteria-1]